MCVVCKAFSFSGVCGVNKGDDDDDDDDDGAFSKESRVSRAFLLGFRNLKP